MGVVLTSDGWRDFTPASGDRSIFVSSSGSDANSGLSEGSPKLTLSAARALQRAGTSDTVYARRGDTFVDSWSHNKTGRSASEPMLVLGAYGTTTNPRPKVVGGVNVFGGSNLAFQSVEFEANGTTDAGIKVNATGSDLIVEDCYAHGYYQDFIGTGSLGSPYRNQTWNRNLADDAADSDHQQGWYLGNLGSGTHNITGNMALRCGFPDARSHCFYFDNPVETGYTLNVRDNIAWPDYPTGGMSNTSEGLKVRGGCTFVNNLMFGCSIGSVIGATNGDGADFNPLQLQTLNGDSNTYLYAADLGGSKYGFGAWIFGVTNGSNANTWTNPVHIGNLSTGTEKAVLVFYRWGGSTAGRVLNLRVSGLASYGAGKVRFDDVQSGYSGLAFSNNDLREPGNVAPLIEHLQNTATGTTFAERLNNRLFSTASTSSLIQAPTGNNLTAYGATLQASAGAGLPAPTRTMVGYLASLGVTESTEADAAAYIQDKFRAQRRYAWDTDYTATSIGDWFRAGMGRPLLGTTPPTPVASPFFYRMSQGAA